MIKPLVLSWSKSRTVERYMVLMMLKIHRFLKYYDLIKYKLIVNMILGNFPWGDQLMI